MALPPVRLHDRLRREAALLGPAAQRWLEAVPRQLAQLVADWQLTLEPQFDHAGSTSVVVPVVTADGTPAVLKLSLPHADALGEAPALRRWDGRHAVRLLQVNDDGLVLLLERCVPGHDLWTFPVDEQISVIAGLLPGLWVEPAGAPVRRLEDTAADWARRMRADSTAFDAPAEAVADAAGWAEQLAATTERRVLLHGDLNPGNVLTAQREPWLAIDPKPWIGDPAFDLAQALMNWIRVSEDASVDAAVERASRLAAAVGVDVGRALRWATVKVVGWGDGHDNAAVLHAAARAV